MVRHVPIILPIENTLLIYYMDQLIDTEKSDYNNAELCLQSPDEELGISGTENLRDAIQWTHIRQTDWIHLVGAFLPWHRYFILTHENLLRDKCGYDGSFPYWDEPTDIENGIASSVFGSDALGGNGNSMNECVADGAFANLTLHMRENVPDDYCLSRNFDDSIFAYSSQSHIDMCLAYDTFVDIVGLRRVRPASWRTRRHGGVMIDTAESPGDTILFLHHTWLDWLWAKWQAVDPDSRTYWIGGTNQPNNYDGDSSAYLNYDGDPGSITTLNHTLWMGGLADNVTAYDVMNISSATNCAVYVYPDDEWTGQEVQPLFGTQLT